MKLVIVDALALIRYEGFRAPVKHVESPESMIRVMAAQAATVSTPGVNTSRDQGAKFVPTQNDRARPGDPRYEYRRV